MTAWREKGVLTYLPLAVENAANFMLTSNEVSFQLKVFGKNIKETTVVSYLTKVTKVLCD